MKKKDPSPKGVGEGAADTLHQPMTRRELGRKMLSLLNGTESWWQPPEGARSIPPFADEEIKAQDGK